MPLIVMAMLIDCDVSRGTHGRAAQGTIVPTRTVMKQYVLSSAARGGGSYSPRATFAILRRKHGVWGDTQRPYARLCGSGPLWIQSSVGFKRKGKIVRECQHKGLSDTYINLITIWLFDKLHFFFTWRESWFVNFRELRESLKLDRLYIKSGFPAWMDPLSKFPVAFLCCHFTPSHWQVFTHSCVVVPLLVRTSKRQEKKERAEECKQQISILYIHNHVSSEGWIIDLKLRMRSVRALYLLAVFAHNWPSPCSVHTRPSKQRFPLPWLVFEIFVLFFFYFCLRMPIILYNLSKTVPGAPHQINKTKSGVKTNKWMHGRTQE